MRIELNESNIRQLIADEGNVLTLATDIPDSEREFSKSLWLGEQDSPSNYMEFDAVMAKEIEEARANALE